MSAGHHVSHRTGTLGLVRTTIRRERWRIAIWMLGLVVIVTISIQAVTDLFTTQQDLVNAAASSSNPAFLAFQGPDQALDTLGGQVAFQIGAPVLVMMGLMALLVTGRMTRGEEEAGRLELVRSLPVGRNAPLLAATIVTGTMSIVIGAAISVAAIAFDLPVAGSVNFGMGYAAVGLVFTGITLVTAQVTENHRLTYGLAGVVLGVSFVLRAIGDASTGVSWMAWLSPIGWAQRAQPYADEIWWPFALAVVVAGLLVSLAIELQSIRDLGAGLVPPRPGPRTARDSLRTPLALMVRLGRGSLVGWTAGTAFLALVYGGLTGAIEDFIDDYPEISDMLVQSGGDLSASYVATSARVVALIGSGLVIQSTLRLRTEESEQRTEPVLGTPVSRPAYWTAAILFAIVGSAVLAITVGLVLGASAAVAVSDHALVWDGTLAMLGYLPAMLVLIGIGAFLVGLAPRAASVTWAMLVIGFVITMFGMLLELPDWAMRLSPFENLPLAPVEPFSIVETAIVTLVGLALLAAGLAGYRRRDIPT
jgi:ABC-2 type transport system permease protein